MRLTLLFVGPLIDSYGTKSVGSLLYYAHLSKATALFIRMEQSRCWDFTAWPDHDEQAVRQQ
jgi:hypothetical protein